MRVLGFIVVGCLVISGLQALVTALALVSVALLAFGIVFRPQTTLAALGLLACWSVVLAYPGVALGLLVLAFVRWWRDQPP
jgi:hypothetical protein